MRAIRFLWNGEFAPLSPQVVIFLALMGANSLIAQDAAKKAAPKRPNLNEPYSERGVKPVDENGNPLNLDFEDGTLRDWTAEGDAFTGQPIRGEIAENRAQSEGKKCEMTGEFWLGGYEKIGDQGVGVLKSKPFAVTHPYASFLVAGGSGEATRVEVVLAEGDRVLFKAHGRNLENLRPAVVDLKSHVGKKIYVRIVDESRDGWGHVNFDDFRFYEKRPKFRTEVFDLSAPDASKLYPYAGIDAQTAASVMVTPPGFEVIVGAAEPEVKQPIAMAIDDRGRIWVAEAYEYPRRAPEGQGRDRILIFEDTNGDGTLDSRKVFADKLNLVSGLEVGYGGVWVGAAPQLLFIPDANGDDAPDGEPIVLLDGWGYEDTHETLNTLTWGPDGWLYGCHGVFTHSKVGKPGAADEQRQKINAGIWRYHPVRHEFEVFAEGSSNPWGIDFNDRGQAFITACVIPHLYHVIQGGRYERQAGTHFNPFTFDDIKTIAEHRHFVGDQWTDTDRRVSDEYGGGHAHAGAMIYLGGAWPEKYTNQIFMHNIHGNRVNLDLLERKGSGFVGKFHPDFLMTGDQWSQMISIKYGPDGQAWMIDWYDKQQCHRVEPDLHDRGNGRIYKVVYNKQNGPRVNLGAMTDSELIGLQSHSNEWHARMARRLLAERHASGKISETTRVEVAKLARSAPNVAHRLRALWVLHAIGGLTNDRAIEFLADRDEYLRAWTLQLLRDDPKSSVSQAVRNRMAEMAENDPSQVVRLYLASALIRMPIETRAPILEKLVRHSEDAADHNLPLMYWYALEPLAGDNPSQALALAFHAKDTIPLLAEFMVRRVGSGDPTKSLAILVDGYQSARDVATKLTFANGLVQSLKGVRRIDADDNAKKLASEWKSANHPVLRDRLVVLASKFGDPSAIDQLREWLSNGSSSDEVRRFASASLVELGDEGSIDIFKKQLHDRKTRSVAMRALASFSDPASARAILDIYGELPADEQRVALNALASRSTYAKELLAAVESRKILSSQLGADLIQQLRNLKDSGLNAEIDRVWGAVRETAADRLQYLEDLKRLVTTETSLSPDPHLGRTVFAKTCQQCHSLYGTGGNLGPDLTGSNRANLDYLLSNVVDPSSVMAKEYRPTVVTTSAGRVLVGLVREETGGAILLQTTQETLPIPKTEIDEIHVSEKSLMPDDLLKPLSKHEMRSLVSYLGTRGQNPMLATADTKPQLFNGNDLTGWVGSKDVWSVDKGEIVGKSATGLAKNEFLVSQWAVEDFHLKLEVKLTTNDRNSGVQFRSQPLADGDVKGYQADIGEGWWGKLYEEHGRGILFDKPSDQHVKKEDWNTYEIQAVGSRVRTWLNGKPCVDLDDPAGARRGIIALQVHSGGPTEVRFRNLSLRVLEHPRPSVAFPVSASTEGKAPKFKKTTIDPRFRSEGVAMGDFNNDGKLDIAAGSVWYEAPDWKPHAILPQANEFSPKTYSDTFCNWGEDLNHDGKLDLIVVDFPGKQTWWFENPGASESAWIRHEGVDVTNDESPMFTDVDGDGQRELVYGHANGQVSLARPTANPLTAWKQSKLSDGSSPAIERFTHGIGVGDLNGDGRNDLFYSQGWWESPENGDPLEWKFHPVNFGEACAQMYAFDFDGDGDKDVVTSSAHRRGIWWHEATDKGFVSHEIDNSIAQTHALILADMNGDGLPDLVTGKRYYAHNGNDPGEDEPPVLAWFELKRANGKPTWTKHEIDSNSGVGTQFEVVDMNRDGKLDIVIANKRGVFYFEQE